MRKIPLIIPFLLALVAHLYGGIFTAPLHLIAFAPFFAISMQRLSLLGTLWTAALTGLLVDMTSSWLRFGFFALSYTLTCWIAYKQRKHFFEDQAISLSLYTAFISCLSSTVQLALLAFGPSRLPLDLPFLATDLLLMPLVDGLYAFLWFTCPLQLYTLIKRFRRNS
jgi:hypothetical protein